MLEDLHGEQFLKAIDIALAAVSDHSKRFAALAREMATAESRDARREELLTIAENCDISPMSRRRPSGRRCSCATSFS